MKSQTTAALLPNIMILSRNGRYLWISKDGTPHYVRDMETYHLFYAARMIYNHSVPPAFRVLRPGEAFKRYDDVFTQEIEAKRSAYRILVDELNNRMLDPEIQYALDDIAENRRFLRVVLDF